MATAEDIEAPLTLELDGEDLTPELFLRGARAFFALVDEVTDAVSAAVKWRVQVKAGSNLIGAWPRPLSPTSAVARIIADIDAGLDAIERDAVEPPSFDERGLASARDLARLSLASDGEIRVRVWTNRVPHHVTTRTLANVDVVLAGAFEEAGAIEGRLQTISERGGAKFVIYDSLTDKAVRCFIPDQMLPDAMAAFGRRAEVYGQVFYDKDGKARRIRANDIFIFPNDEDLPSAADVRGILGNMPQ